MHTRATARQLWCTAEFVLKFKYPAIMEEFKLVLTAVFYSSNYTIVGDCALLLSNKGQWYLMTWVAVYRLTRLRSFACIR